MGCGIHSILQQKNEDGTWETKITDVIQLCSSDARNFNTMLAEVASQGVPGDLKIREEKYDFGGTAVYLTDQREDFFLGEHGHYHLTLKDFCDNIETTKQKGFHIYEEDGLIHLTIGNDMDYRETENIISDLQAGFRTMFFDLNEYRLVIGFDS